MTQYAILMAVVMVFLYLGFTQRLFTKAKNHDPVYFEGLGSPHIIMNNTPKHSWLLLKAIFSRNYKYSKSKEVVRAGNAVTLLFWLTLLSYGWVIYAINHS